MNPYGTYFYHPEGLLTVEMATFEEKNSHDLHDVLLKFSGYLAYAEGIDGQVLRYSTIPSGTGIDFRHSNDGKEYSRMSSRKLWGSWDSMEVHFGGKSHHIRIAPNMQAEVKPLHLQTAWKESQTQQKVSEVNPYGMMFRAADGSLEIEMAVYSAKNDSKLHDVILKFKGAAAHDAGIDGIAQKYEAVNAGTGHNFRIMENGKQRNRLQTRSSWGSWQNYDVYFGNKHIPVYIDPYGSESVRPLHLLTELKQNQ